MSSVWAYLSVIALMLTGLLLIFIILLQRGRGGGLAGAFGGAGGQSALGTKAGDVFTRITVGLAVFWVFLACLSIYALRAGSEGRLSLGEGDEGDAVSAVPAPAVADEADEEGPVPGEDRPQGATGAATTRPGIEAQPPAVGDTDEAASDSGPALGTPADGEAATGGDAAAEGGEAPAGETP
ncbi:MAG TPA: preprotein translocase subunit SecG [Planctomycetaceae bacterium]